MVFLTHSIRQLASFSLPRQASRSLYTASKQTARRSLSSESALHRCRYQTRNHIGIRTLTTEREKVKVLLVLYDGHKHAEEVSEFSSPCYQLTESYLLGTQLIWLGGRELTNDVG